MKNRKGTVSILVAICLTVLVGICAIVIDGGLLMHNKRKVQSAADVAALAGAEDLYYNWAANKGQDSGSAKSAAITVASDNGYSNVVVNIPPQQAQSSQLNGRVGCVEVIVTYQQPRYFSTIWGTATLPVKGHAIACAGWSGNKNSIIVLDATGSSALKSNGGAQVTTTGAPIMIDSNSSSAASANGSAKITASQINIVGNPNATGNGLFVGPVATGVTPIPDPLAYLPSVDPSNLMLQNAVKATNGTQTLLPGRYKGGISATNSASLILQPGIYYMEGGGFNFSGKGSLTGTGVLIYNEPSISSDSISINGQATVSISPMTTGIYQGISLWQDRNSAVPVNITGNGKTSISGTFYAAAAQLNVVGNGSNDIIGSQYITFDLKVSGNGSWAVNWSDSSVGRARTIFLAE